jgi:HEAT repeat protein
MEDKDWGVVRQAAWSLGLIGRTEAIPAIAKLAARGPKIHAEAAGAGGGGTTAIAAVGNAIVSAARFRHAPTFPAVADLLNDRPSMMDPGRPIEVRAAAYYLFGVVGNASDTQTCGKLLDAYGNIFESPLVKLEALKSLAHVKYEPATDRLLKISESDPMPELRYVGHWAYQYVTGKTIPLEVPVVSWRPDVSINDASDAEQGN